MHAILALPTENWLHSGIKYCIYVVWLKVKDNKISVRCYMFTSHYAMPTSLNGQNNRFSWVALQSSVWNLLCGVCVEASHFVSLWWYFFFVHTFVLFFGLESPISIWNVGARFVYTLLFRKKYWFYSPYFDGMSLRSLKYFFERSLEMCKSQKFCFCFRLILMQTLSTFFKISILQRTIILLWYERLT